MKRICALVMAVICIFSVFSFSCAAAAQTIAPPSAKSIKTTVTSTTASVTWGAVKNAKGYRFYTYNDSEKKWVIALSKTDQLGVDISNLLPGRKYTFAIKSYTTNSKGKTLWSSKYTSFSILTRPENVKTLKATYNLENNSIKLTWSKSEGATGYKVYRYIPSTKSWKALKTTTARSYTVTKLTAGKKYIFAVRPYAKQDGMTSLAAKLTKVGIAAAPKAPTKLRASASTNSVTLKWNASEGATGYRVYIWNATKKKYDVASSSVSSTTVKITNLKAGRNYIFAVKPYTRYAGINSWGELAKLKVTTNKAESTTENTSRTIYRTKSGTKYHYANPCGNGTYYAITLAEAKKANLKPCEKCVLS